MSSHLDTIRSDDAYADILANWDQNFYGKYTDALKQTPNGGRILDVGCGVGQVVQQLEQAGFEAHGVDVAAANIERAQKISARCQLYDGSRLPFPDDHFQSVGALNVLEHVEQPEEFLRELVRVTAAGGRIVISSPNFYRVLGWRDYHPQMRGLGRKLKNWRRVRAKQKQMLHAPEQVKFDRMTPIIKTPFTPDDDAIVATNPLEMEFFLKRYGCEILRSECTDRYVARAVDLLLNCSPLHYLMFNAFVVAQKKSPQAGATNK